MPIFAPVYRPPKSQQSFLTREQKRHRKRKRSINREDDQDSKSEQDSTSDQEDDAPRVAHPVSKTDPYYVAGHSREQSLPGGNFPHAAQKDPDTAQVSVEEELARLNPPVFLPTTKPEPANGSWKRRHLDNLTAILHQCMLRQDWYRASRAWGLILRTEIQGYGPDIRQHGRWLVGAELLMRRDHDASSLDDSDLALAISDRGFRLAREYYELLILQYPHRANAPHSALNALAIYPALFNVWIYEVQGRAKRAREAESASSNSSSSSSSSNRSESSSSPPQSSPAPSARASRRELSEATPIAQRMDELLLNPPYDKSTELLRLRGMVGLWICDLHKTMAENYEARAGTFSGTEEDEEDEEQTEDEGGDPSSRGLRAARYHRQRGEAERMTTHKVFQRMSAGKGVEVSREVRDFLAEKVREGAAEDDSWT